MHRRNGSITRARAVVNSRQRTTKGTTGRCPGLTEITIPVAGRQIFFPERPGTPSKKRPALSQYTSGWILRFIRPGLPPRRKRSARPLRTGEGIPPHFRKKPPGQLQSEMALLRTSNRKVCFLGIFSTIVRILARKWWENHRPSAAFFKKYHFISIYYMNDTSNVAGWHHLCQKRISQSTT
jgi:hypothetical protein